MKITKSSWKWGGGALLLLSLTSFALGDSGTQLKNPVDNPGFEQALEPWEWYVAGKADASGEVSTTEKHSGTSSYLMSNGSPVEPNVYGQLRQYVTGLRASTTYRLTFWVKGADVSGAAIACGPEWLTRKPLPEGSYDWTEFTIDFTTGETVEKYEIVFLAGGPIGSLWIDDVAIAEADGAEQ